jgi:4-hydroxy 2-oxovalerate aldolase
VKILDCTLRDGGYYTSWDFESADAEKLVLALSKAGVDIIELGYKSLANNAFYGLFKYCHEDMLQFFAANHDAEYAFMIDAKEFVTTGDEICKRDLDGIIKDKTRSCFDWVRIATYFSTMEAMPALATYFSDKGYKVSLNLMGGSLITRDQLLRALKIAEKSNLSAFYFSDSFGSFYPEDVIGHLRFIRQHYPGEIGLHLHDNQGLAYANGVAAVGEGIDFIDSTVLGMGRGAGNLATDQLMQFCKEKLGMERYYPNQLLGITNNYILPLKEKYKWGQSFSYMLSGLKNIHPTYCQALNDDNRYTMAQVYQILERIPDENRNKFTRDVLDRAIKEVFEKPSGNHSLTHIPEFSLTHHDKILIAASGPSTLKYKPALLKLIELKDLYLMECNDTGFFEEIEQKIIVILNEIRLQRYVGQQNKKRGRQVVITGVAALPEYLIFDGLRHFPYELGVFDISSGHLSIPDYDVGMYCVALSILSGAKEIYLAGFDGFDEPGKNERMEGFFKQACEFCKKNNIRMVAVTPTVYSDLPKSSVYGWLQS